MYTTYYPNGLPYIVERRVNGKRNGTVLIYNVSGQEISTMKYNIQVCYISYLQNGSYHNLHGPATISWLDVQIYSISYRQNNTRHNEHGPAFMSWYSSGQFYYIEYMQNGFLHNLHGPAYMRWYDGKILFYVCHFGNLIKEYAY